MIQEDGRKRELVVGVVRKGHVLLRAAGLTKDTIGYFTSDGHLVNACDKKDTESSQPVEGSSLTLKYNNPYGSETKMF